MQARGLLLHLRLVSQAEDNSNQPEKTLIPQVEWGDNHEILAF